MPITKSDRDLRFLLSLGVPIENIAQARAGRTVDEIQAELSAPSDHPRTASPTPPPPRRGSLNPSPRKEP